MRSERARSTPSSWPWTQPTARDCAKRLRSAGRSVGVRGGMKRSRGCSPSASREWPSKTIRRPGDRGARGILRHDASRNQAHAQHSGPNPRPPSKSSSTRAARPGGHPGSDPHRATRPRGQPAEPVGGAMAARPPRGARDRGAFAHARSGTGTPSRTGAPRSEAGPGPCASPRARMRGAGSDQIVPSIRRLDSGYSTIIRRCSGELFQLPGRM